MKPQIVLSSEEEKILQNAFDESYGGMVPIEFKALEKGLRAVLPEPDELFIDIDTEEDFRLFQFHLMIMSDRMGEEFTFDAIPSKSGLPHRHIVVTMPFELAPDQLTF